MSTQEIIEARKRWTREETLLLLQCYNARKDEFKHCQKKRYAYANVLEDMLAMGFVDTTITTRALEAKMRTLLIAYKSAKDNNRQAGATYCAAPFMEEMDEIFGREPVISNTHTLNLGATMQTPLSESRAPAAVESLSSPFSPITIEIMPTSDNASSSGKSSNSSTNNSRKRKSAKENYYEKQLELKEKFYEDVKKMIANKLNAP